MFLNSKEKGSITTISIHAELIMYGDAFLNIKNNGDNGITVDWLSLCDGGDVADQGERSYSSISFQDIVDYFYSIDFPEQENADMNISWEIQCYNQNDDMLESNGFGYWSRDVIMYIINWLQEITKDDAPFLPMIDTLNA